MWTIHRALTLRREQPKWFGEKAAYAPLQVEGAKANHVIAYVRGESVCTIVPRFTTKVNGAWQDTFVVVPEGAWRNRLTGVTQQGGRIAMKLLLKDFPVALLVREDSVHA
jgi:(1->4)-alpha-D-glucan 1-alpha-D-glucosylmutase